MLPYDPAEWLRAQKGLSALRARRLLGIEADGDEAAAGNAVRDFAKRQSRNGSFDTSPMQTAGIMNLIADLGVGVGGSVVDRAASYLISVLESQPGYSRAGGLRPGGLTQEWDLCGFFGPYENRGHPRVVAAGAREMNFYREFEPLLGPKSPVRAKRRSTLDRAGPPSCYSWGLIPLAYTLETLYRAGHAWDKRVTPALKVLLAAQRTSGGWCRGLSGHPSCSTHAVRALGAHPDLRTSTHAQRALEFLREAQTSGDRQMRQWWKGSNVFAVVQAVAAVSLPIAREILRDALAAVAPLQRRNGSFARPCAVEKVLAAFLAERALRTA